MIYSFIYFQVFYLGWMGVTQKIAFTEPVLHENPTEQRNKKTIGNKDNKYIDKQTAKIWISPPLLAGWYRPPVDGSADGTQRGGEGAAPARCRPGR